MAAGKCVFCGEDVDAKTGYRKVTGWVRWRVQGGTNSLALRANTDEWACFFCIDRQKRGVAMEQETLL